MLCCDRSKLFYYERQKKTDIKFLNLNVLPAHASEAPMFGFTRLENGNEVTTDHIIILIICHHDIKLFLTLVEIELHSGVFMVVGITISGDHRST